MSIHNICFCGEIKKILCGYPLLSVAMLMPVTSKLILTSPILKLKLHHLSKTNYSWLSLSQTRLSRITAYLDMKIWSLPKHEHLTTGKKYCRKEEKLLLRSNFSSFPQYFQYISNFKNLITYTVKPVLVVTSIKQPTCIKQPEEGCPKIHRHIYLNCIKQPPVFSSHILNFPWVAA